LLFAPNAEILWTELPLGSQHVVVHTVDRMVSVLALDGQLLRQTQLQEEDDSGVLDGSELLIFTVSGHVRLRIRLLDDSVASHTSDKMLFALRQRQAQGAQEHARSERVLQEKKQLELDVSNSFASGSRNAVSVKSVTQAFDGDGSWVACFRLVAGSLGKAGRLILGVHSCTCDNQTLSVSPGVVFERTVVVPRIDPDQKQVIVALEWDDVLLVLGHLTCLHLEDQRRLFKSNAFAPIHTSAKR
jgi:hypothetical protein